MNKRANTFLTSAAVLASIAFPVTAIGADPVDQLAWLPGCWTTDNAEAGSGEQWMPAAGGMLLGMSRTVRGGKTVGWEFMRIGNTPEGKLAFFAQPGGKPPATFAVLKQSATEVVFENPDHDFPQRVIYRFESPDKLRASIEGVRNGTTRSIPYPMTRVSCDGLKSPATR
jgi:hypothetical protein